MNYEQALDYIHSVNTTFCKPGTDRIRALCGALGNPQDKLRFVHVAGTNGKGSFCAMLTSILTAAGYRTGRFTSPYVKSFCERIAIGDASISEDALTALVERVRPVVDTMQDKPTEFELITALGFLYFAEQGCDLVVLECGLGGRLDATNVIQTPILSVITGIALDHTAYLGDTTAAIAREKAGILRRGVPLLGCGEDPDADRVIRAEAERIGAPLFTVEATALRIVSWDLSGTVLDYKQYHRLHLPLLGTYQPKNASRVLSAVELLQSRGFSIPEDAVRRGLALTVWHARFELLSRNPIILADGGHNPEGVHAAVESVRTYFGDKRVLILSGLMADKEYKTMANLISEIAAEVFCVTPANPRSLPADDYAEEYRKRGIAATPYASVKDAVAAAVTRARQTNTPLISLGSLYLYGEFCDALEACSLATR